MARPAGSRRFKHAKPSRCAKVAKDMKIIQIISVSGLVAILQSSPLPAYDGYGTPDPGWYNQGSAMPRYDDSRFQSNETQGAGSGSSWYSSDWYADQSGVRRGSEPAWNSGAGWGSDTWSNETPARADTRPGYADPGYGDDLWSREQRPDAREYPTYQEPPRTRPDPFADSRTADPYYDSRSSRERDVGYDQGWRQPPARPEYRFRDDPRLDSPGIGGKELGYQFRPLTERERERHRESASSSQFTPRDDWRRERARPSDDRGDAFGYQPDSAPGSFYDRYYRTGP